MKQWKRYKSYILPYKSCLLYTSRALDDVCRGSALYGCVRGEADRHLFDSCKADQSEGRDPDRVKAVSGENCPVVLCEKIGKKYRKFVAGCF